LSEFAPQVVAALADSIFNNSFDEQELEATANDYRETVESSQDLGALVAESLHAAAYQNNTLGLPIVAPLRNLPKFTGLELRQYVDTWFRPSRMVIAGAGISHDELVKLANESFNRPEPKSVLPIEDVRYTGGELRFHRPPHDFVQLALAFPTASWRDSDLAAMCVLQTMMGGGGVFAPGGPGLGLRSRLYENILSKKEWVFSATCFNSIFSESSLFALSGSCLASHAGDFVNILTDEARKMAGPVEEEELQRARNQLKAAVLTQFDSRNQRLDEVGRHLVLLNEIQTADELVQRIDRVQSADIVRVAEKMLKAAPSLAIAGDPSQVPRYNIIADKLKK